MARSKGPVRAWSTLRGIVTLIPRLRACSRSLWWLYPLSPTMRPGLSLGRPLPARLTAPCFRRASKTVASCCWPGVRMKVMGLPFPSALMCTFVDRPPLLRPIASASRSPFFHQPSAGGLGRSCYLRSGPPSQSLPGCRLPSGVRPAPYPTLQPSSIYRSGWLPSSRGRIVLGDRATVSRYAAPTVSRSSSGEDPCSVGQYSVSQVGVASRAAPTARSIVRACAYLKYARFENTP